MTSTYQFIFILPEGDDKAVSQVEEIIKKTDGTIDKQETWGKKSFAYVVNKLASGYYYDWVITAPVAKIKEFKNLLNLNNTVIRYLLLKQA